VSSRRESHPESAARLTLLPAVVALDPEPASADMKPFAPVRMAELPPAVAVAGAAPRPVARSEMANEIRARVAGFRAHQERFNRQRRQYFSPPLARLRATLNDRSPRRSEE